MKTMAMVSIATLAVALGLFFLLVSMTEPSKPAQRKEQKNVPIDLPDVMEELGEFEEVTQEENLDFTLVPPNKPKRVRRTPYQRHLTHPTVPTPVPEVVPEENSPKMVSGLKLVIQKPIDRSFVLKPYIIIKAQAQGATLVLANGQYLSTRGDGEYSGQILLHEGHNQIVVEAKASGSQKVSKKIRVTYIAPKKLAQEKKSFLGLLDQLDHVRHLGSEVNGRIQALLSDIKETHDADEVSLINEELNKIKQERMRLEKDIQAIITELDTLLLRAP